MFSFCFFPSVFIDITQESYISRYQKPSFSVTSHFCGILLTDNQGLIINGKSEKEQDVFFCQCTHVLAQALTTGLHVRRYLIITYGSISSFRPLGFSHICTHLVLRDFVLTWGVLCLLKWLRLTSHYVHENALTRLHPQKKRVPSCNILRQQPEMWVIFSTSYFKASC